MTEKVKCTVSNCSHWQNDYCKASAIEVKSSCDGSSVRQDCETLCNTFAPKL